MTRSPYHCPNCSMEVPYENGLSPMACPTCGSSLVLRLSEKDFKAFAAALLDPPRINPALRRALQARSEFLSEDLP